MWMTKATARLIERERVCRVATAGGRGMPHLVPVCQALAGGKIYFASGNDGRKAHLKGVMVQGRAGPHPRGASLDPSDPPGRGGESQRGPPQGLERYLPHQWLHCSASTSIGSVLARGVS